MESDDQRFVYVCSLMDSKLDDHEGYAIICFLSCLVDDRLLLGLSDFYLYGAIMIQLGAGFDLLELSLFYYLLNYDRLHS